MVKYQAGGLCNLKLIVTFTLSSSLNHESMDYMHVSYSGALLLLIKFITFSISSDFLSFCLTGTLRFFSQSIRVDEFTLFSCKIGFWIEHLGTSNDLLRGLWSFYLKFLCYRMLNVILQHCNLKYIKNKVTIHVVLVLVSSLSRAPNLDPRITHAWPL